MTGLLICVFLIMGSMAVWADQTGAVSGQTRVFDQAGLFSETEKIQLEEEIAQCRKNTKMDVVVVSAYADDRTAEEYAAGHIPGSILVPVESIGDTKPVELPDTEAVLLVHCRTGIRSKRASDQLVELGYKHVYDFGGIVDWPYETVTEN